MPRMCRPSLRAALMARRSPACVKVSRVVNFGLLPRIGVIGTTQASACIAATDLLTGLARRVFAHAITSLRP
jgi:hypothetical protein